MVRLSPELLAKLDAHVEALNGRASGPRWTRSDFVRDALVHALEGASRPSA